MAKIHLIVSDFNHPIPEQLLQGALQAFKDKNIATSDLVITHVPGAFELPLAALLAARQKQTEAVICLGAVIRGETSHYDYVCDQTASGIMQAGLQTLKPVLFGVLTTDNEAQALSRAQPDKTNKGYECALAALTMIAVKTNLN
jgi:6,7-dimethyl-8-ribityllumazine synthase